MQQYRLLLIWSLRVGAVLWLLVGIYRAWTALAPAFDPIYRDSSSASGWAMFALENASAAVFPSLFLVATAEVLALSLTRTIGKDVPR
jgi:hypothetical protein